MDRATGLRLPLRASLAQDNELILTATPSGSEEAFR
jgi:hypothetical protein